MTGQDGDEYSGGCLCGRVRYTARARPLWVVHCHCSSCRHHTSSPAATFIGFPEQAVRWSVRPACYESSPGVTRQFCAHCGTPLAYASRRYAGELHLLVGSLDKPERAPPQAHVWASERVPWLHLDPHLPEWPGPGPEVGADD